MLKSINAQMEFLSLWVVSHPIVSKIVEFLYSLPISRHFIPLFCRMFQVNQQEAEKPVRSYHSLRDFFIRHLRGGARKICSSNQAVVSPVDGSVVAMGKIRQNSLLQVKGKSYTLNNLLASEQNSKRFLNGKYLTIYMSPGKYHRVHAPFDCKIAGNLSDRRFKISCESLQPKKSGESLLPECERSSLFEYRCRRCRLDYGWFLPGWLGTYGSRFSL